MLHRAEYGIHNEHGYNDYRALGVAGKSRYHRRYYQYDDAEVTELPQEHFEQTLFLLLGKDIFTDLVSDALHLVRA